jgi:nucleotide-binding universal stress UspA family protein
MKTILLPFHDDDVSQRALELSARILRPTNGYLEGLFVMRRPPMVEGDSSVFDESQFTLFDEESRRVAAQARTRFEACVANQGLAIEAVSASGKLAAGWREISGAEGQVVGSHGRLFDLIVVGREFGRSWLNWRVIVESALFESGRPVLLTANTPTTSFGENVFIAWNSSTETARTVAFAMPLLARARAVTIVSVEGWGIPGPSGEELFEYLRRAGVPATTARTVPPKGRSPGLAILDECDRSGADLLLKGAYTQSRLRQMIFGGATRDILAHAEIPVLFAN